MKKYGLVLMTLLLCIIGADSQKVKAYTVTVEKDGIYAEVVPDSFVNNAAPFFKSYVNKAMKYYNKYKDADDYTYVSEVPEEQRDFIPVVKQIQDSDEIIIRNPFYIYCPGENGGVWEYNFFAEKNGKKLCMFCIDIDSYSGKVSFWYDKIKDGFFTNDDKITGETLFYEMDKIIYAETSDGIHVVRDENESSWGERKEMIGGNETDWEAVAKQEAEEEAELQKFEKKSYSEKKDEILSYLAGTKSNKYTKKVEKKIEKNLKQELGDEYIWSEEDAEESDRTAICIAIGIGVVVIGVIIGGIIIMTKRKEE